MPLTTFSKLPAIAGNAKFDGAAASGNAVVMAPLTSDVVGLVVDGVFSNVSIPSQIQRFNRKFSGAATHNGIVYFAPQDADAIGVFDVAARSFSTVSCSMRRSSSWMRSAFAWSKYLRWLWSSSSPTKTPSANEMCCMAWHAIM